MVSKGWEFDPTVIRLRAALAQPKPAPTVYVLTAEYNDYDQHGEYFEEVWAKKPTVEELAKARVPPEECEHVLAGGGRLGDQHRWFHLREEPLL